MALILFQGIPNVPAAIVGNDLSCGVNQVTLSADSLINAAIYTWETPDGNIISSSEGTSIDIDEPGTYILHATAMAGCITQSDTIVVSRDTIPPNAIITDEPSYGCDASYFYLEGGENGMEYLWSGPNGFTSTDQYINVSDTGLYILEVTRPDNGCKDRDSIYLVNVPCQPAYGNPPDVDINVLIDTIPPTFSVPKDKVISCQHDPDNLLLTGDVYDEDDNCDPNIGKAIYSDNPVYGLPCNGETIITRTWSLVDECGNVNEQVQTIHMQDNVAPTFTVPADITIDCNLNPNDFTLVGEVDDPSDNCDTTSLTVDFSDNINTNTPCNGSTVIVRTWRVTDACNNERTASQTITLIDSIPPIFTVPNDITLECDQDPMDLNLTGDVYDESDNCNSAIGQASYSDVIQTDPNCDAVKTITRTWTLSDDCGNTTSQIQTITIQDSTPPEISGISSIPNVECDAIPYIPQVGIDIFITDNCTDDSSIDIVFDSTRIAGTCPNTFTLVWTWTATDDCGNVAIDSMLLYVEDTGTPQILTFPGDMIVECDSIPPYGDITVDDNCASSIAVTFSETRTDGGCNYDYFITRVWIWTDDCGNSNSHTQIVTVQDTKEPTFTAPTDLTIDCISDVFDLNVTGDISDEQDNCDVFVEATFQDSIITGGFCSSNIQIKRQWTLTDSCGNSSFAIQTISLIDTVAPVFSIPADITLDCISDIEDLNITGDVIDESDNCDTNLGEASYVNNVLDPSVCRGNRIVERTWSLEDDCGNLTTGIQTITLLDTLPPSFTVPDDITLDCEGKFWDVNVTGNVFDEWDNCTTAVSQATFQDSVDINPPCEGTTIRFRIWSLIDDCGNTTIDTQKITLVDLTPPSFTTPNDITIACDTDLNDLSFTGDVSNEMDNCDTTLSQAIYTDSLDISGDCSGSTKIIRTWSLSDDCGNIATGIQNIFIEDNIAPDFDVPSDITLDCDTDISDLTLSGNVTNLTDNCDTTQLNALYQDSIVLHSPCLGASQIYRTWIIEDDCGNRNEQIQIITLEDNSPPSFNFPKDTIISCDVSTDSLSITGFPTSGFDNCDPYLLAPTYYDSLIQNTPCVGSSKTIRIWIAADNCGNEIRDTQEIVQTDITAPIFTTPSDITLDCNVDVSDLTITGDVHDEDDNCDSNSLEAIYRDSVVVDSHCGNTRLIVRIWSLADACGNIQTGEQRIELIDTIPPLFTIPNDITLDCSVDERDLSITGDVMDERDNCDSNSLEATYRDSIVVNGICESARLIIRIWSLSDACGNIQIGEQRIELIDTIPPLFTIPDDITLDCSVDERDLSITGDVMDERDNCDNNSLEATYRDSIVVNGICESARLIIRIWSLSDACGNVQTGEQRIELIDTIPPLFTVPDDVTLDCSVDENDLSITGDVMDERDNCDSNSLETTYRDSIVVNGTCESGRLIVRIWSLADACGNVQTGEQRIELIDTIPPLFTIPDDITLDCSVDENNLTVTGDVFDESDNCDSNSLEATYRDSIVVNGTCESGRLIVRIWSLADACGNIQTGEQRIELIDTIPPLFTIPNDVTLDCSVDERDLSITGDVMDESDNCDNNSLEATYKDSTVVNGTCESARLIIRIWSLSDACGNVQTGEQRIELIDTIPPLFTIPDDVTLDCSVDESDLSITGDVFDESDNCDNNSLEATYRDSTVVNGTCESGRLIVRIWSLADACGNVQTGEQRIELIDTIPPLFTIPDNITLDCSVDENNLTVTGDVFDESDNCDNNSLEATYRDSTVVNGTCESARLIIRIWSLSDACGNVQTGEQRIELIDTIPPLFTIPDDVTLDCSVDESDLSITGDVFDESDNCDNNSLEATYRDSTVVNGTCESGRLIVRIWSLADACGNVQTGEQRIELIDTIPPLFTVPDDVTLDCSADENNLTVTGDVFDESDSCDSNLLEATYRDSTVVNGTCESERLIVRIWSLADACGNVQTREQRIELIDTIPPLFTIPNDVTLDCSADESDLSITGDVMDESDNCSSYNLEATYSDSLVLEGMCGGSRLIIRTWTLSDACGNTKTGVQHINLVNSTSPVFTVPLDITLDCGVDENDLSITGEVVDGADDCSNVSLTAQYQDSIVIDGYCGNSRLIVRLWSLADDCGNTQTGQQRIELIDTIPPTFTVPPDTIISCDVDENDLSITGDVLNENDSCLTSIGESIYSDSVVVSNDCANSIIIYRKWTLNDPCGNHSSQTQVITQMDITPPTFTVPEDITIYCGQDPNDLGQIGDVINEADNCDSILPNAIYTDSTSNNSPCTGSSEIIRTWSLTDACGNVQFQIQKITLSDTIAPRILNVPGDTTVNCHEIPVASNPDIEDDCAGSTSLDMDEHIEQGACLDYYTLIRTWTATDPCGNYTTAQQHIHVINCSPTATTEVGPSTLICGGQPASFNVTLSSGYTNPVFQWQYSSNQVEWINIQNASDSTYIIDSTSLSDIGWYRVVVANDSNSLSDSSCNVISDHSRLDILPTSPPNTISANICEGDSIIALGRYFNETGFYSDTLTAINGCDSIINFNLTVNPHQIDSNIHRLCFGQVLDGITYYTDTSWVDSLLTLQGCNHIVKNIITVEDTFRDTVEIDLCEGDIFNGSLYNQDTLLTEHHLSVYGCDSLIYTQIKVHPNYSIIEEYILCPGAEFDGIVIYSDTTFVKSFTTQNGCDSIITQNIIVLPHYNFTERIDICLGESYDGIFYNNDTILINSFTTIDQCDSLYTTQIFVHHPSDEIHSINICEGGTYQGITYFQDTTWVDSLQSIFGCDSVVTTIVVIENNLVDSMIIELCEGESYDGQIFYADTSLVERFSASGGCDSLFITQIMVHPIHQDIVQLEICEGDSIYIDGAYRYTSSVFVEEKQNIYNCDSLIITELIVHPAHLDEQLIQICEGDSILISGSYYYSSISVREEYQNEFGCDSIVNYNLDFVPHFETQIDLLYCFGDSVFYNGQYLNDPQIIRDTLISYMGCDSIIIVDIHETDAYVANEEQTICEGESILIYGEIQNTAGTYTDTLMTSSGCDSILITELNVLGQIENHLLEIICEGEEIYIDGVPYSTSGSYTNQYTAQNGCDSTVYTTIVVRNPNQSYFRKSICEGESILINGVQQTEAGFFHEYLPGSNGCDSIITTELIVLPKIANRQLFSFCEGDSIQFNGNFYNNSITFYDTLTNSMGCDSIITTDLIMHKGNKEIFDQQFICEGDSILIFGNWEKESGEFIKYFATEQGCDSVITIELIVEPKLELNGDSGNFCEGEEIQFLIPHNQSGQITWTPTDYLSCENCFDPIANPPDDRTYIGEYTDVCYEDPVKIPLDVDVRHYPGIEVMADADLLKGDTIQLSAYSPDTNAILTWYTNYRDTLCYDCDTVLVTPSYSSQYRVIADNGNGCPSEDDVNINIHDSCEYGYLKVPNIIVPKSGNYGSKLEIDYKGMEISVLRIFNRWGELVFETEDIDNKWDGTYRGEDLNPGVYVYYIIGRCLNNELFLYKGNITLIN